MNNILVFTPAYKEQTSQNMADFIKFCKDDLTLFNPKNTLTHVKRLVPFTKKIFECLQKFDQGNV